MPAETPSFLHSFARPAAPASAYVNIVRASGSTVVDDQGREYIDALASLWYCNAGHGDERIVSAIEAQIRQLACFHTFDRFTNPPADMLCERVAGLSGLAGSRVFLASGGSEAVETAIKLARIAHAQAGQPERTLLVSRAPSYHGVTYGAVSLTGLPANQQGFGPLVGDVVQLAHDDLDALDALIAERGDRIAAVIAEPVIGAGGVVPPAPGYLAGLRDRCTATGAFLIFDEVISGFGRLGQWFGWQRFGVEPDMLTFAKGVTSGYLPVGGVVVGRSVCDALEADDSFVLRHGNTYSGHPAACAAGLANLDVLEGDGLVERAGLVGKQLADGLRSLVDGDRVLETRGDGAVWAIRLGESVSAVAVRDALLERGVIVRPIGTDVVAYCPPLVIDEGQIDAVVARTGDAIAALA